MNRNALSKLWAAVAASLAALPVAAAMDEGEQVVRAASGYSTEREPSTLREIGTLEERRFTPEDRAAFAKSRGSSTKSASTLSTYVPEHWIYDASVELLFDADGDGFFRYLLVTFDVDSLDDRAWVYAVLYLSPDGEVWELLHETDDFRVDGATSRDAYEVEVELVSGYPPGDYDLLIELYDANTGLLVDELGPEETSAFALLPLEDEVNDLPTSVIIVEEGGGGAFGWPGLAWLAGSGLA
ncbi:MAG: choice-of-anchor H family protein, partial [Gammaproteobacteria bacterium]